MISRHKILDMLGKNECYLKYITFQGDSVETHGTLKNHEIAQSENERVVRYYDLKYSVLRDFRVANLMQIVQVKNERSTKTN